jgi:septum site-determining protein MinC
MTTDLSNPGNQTPIPGTEAHPEHLGWHVQLQSEEGAIKLLLPSLAETPTETSWVEIWEQLQQRLKGAKRFWQPLTPVQLYAQDRLLDARQLQIIADALGDVQLRLHNIHTSRRQTAVAAATAGYSVQQQEPDQIITKPALADPLYLQMTIRSGVEIRHPGTIVIMGDVNPGGEVIAAGDIIIWGRLRGIAHAGSQGNNDCLIMALQMNPTQLRIAGYVARSPEQQPTQPEPEVAYVVPEGIRITRASDVKSVPALADRNHK